MATQAEGFWKKIGKWFGCGCAQPRSLPPGAGESELRSRIATLEMDVQQRDEQIAAMKREYASVETARDRAAAAGGQEQSEKLLRKLCGPLSNLATLGAAVKAGKDVSAGDMADLVGDMQKALAGAGLQMIGEPGQATTFDTAAHQRMSGGGVHPGSAVVVRIPGFKLGDKVLQKAMVSGKEE